MDKAPLSKEFVSAFALVALASVLGIMGAILLALPLGLIGGFVLIKEMIKQYFE
jgi:hypothetical protein